MILVVVFIKVWPKVFSDTVHLSDVHYSSKVLVEKDRFG